MIKILIVDDNITKQQSIIKSLYDESNISEDNIYTAISTKDAKRKLYEIRFDLMILDLVLPIEPEGEPEAQNGIRLLNEIPMNTSIKSPIHIIGLSSHDDMIEIHRHDFQDKLWNLINYDAMSYEWQDKLNAVVQHLLKTRQDFLNASIESQLDILFNRLKEENKPIPFLGHDWKTICDNLVKIIERSLEVPAKFSNGNKAKNISKNTMKIGSEYDFQNLIHLILRPWIPSVEPENIAIIFDGNTKNADFSINTNAIIIEAKHIIDTSTKNTTMKTIEGLKDFYKKNANVKALIFLLLVEDKVDIDKHKIETEYSITNKEPYVFVKVINNKLS